MLIEPVAYVTYQGTRVAFTATEAAKYNLLVGGTVRKKMPSLTHKNLPLALFLETSDLGYPAWEALKHRKYQMKISSVRWGLALCGLRRL